MTGPDDLATAAAAYQRALGHAVPREVLQMFALRPGPLILEIRQAIALQRPVAAWLTHSRRVQSLGIAAHEA
jgi:hypothetical protein